MTGDLDKLSESCRLIVSAAFLRGITVRIIVAESGYFTLTYDGVTVRCTGALTEHTSVIAEKICYDKRLANTILDNAGLSVPVQIVAGSRSTNTAFLEAHDSLVVKPVSQSSGRGISIDIRDPDELEAIIDTLLVTGDETILLEQYMPGEDLRVIVIDGTFIAATHRVPPHVTGNGNDTIAKLIEYENTLRKPHNQIPANYETERCIGMKGYTLDHVPEHGVRIAVRLNTNEHTGGTPVDVTDRLSDTIRRAAEKTARVIDIPVVGIDFMVPSIEGSEYTIIEANSRPGLDGHEPQPVVEAFLDSLFPASRSAH
jgi:GNAT-family acetyltransferase (TIGR03103 family)